MQLLIVCCQQQTDDMIQFRLIDFENGMQEVGLHELMVLLQVATGLNIEKDVMRRSHQLLSSPLAAGPLV